MMTQSTFSLDAARGLTLARNFVCALAATVASLMSFAPTGNAHAQDAYAALACTAIVADAERLACYDRALRTTPRQEQPAAAAAVGSAPVAEASESGAAAAATAGAAAAQSAASSSSITTSPRTVRDARAPSPAAPAQPAPAPAVAPADQGAIGIVPIIVVSTRALPGRGTEFTTDGGEIWIQTDSQHTPLPTTPFNAEIKPGVMGSMFLVPTDRRAVRVRKRE